MAFAIEVAALQRGLPFFLEIILAALDLVDDRFLVAAGDRRLEVLEALVRLAQERTAVFGIAAEAANFGAQLLDDLLPVVRALAEDFAQPLIIDVLGTFLVTGDAVDRRRDQGVERADCLGMLGHFSLLRGIVRCKNARGREPMRAAARKFTGARRKLLSLCRGALTMRGRVDGTDAKGAARADRASRGPRRRLHGDGNAGVGGADAGGSREF